MTKDYLVLSPLIPDGSWTFFCLDRLLYHGRWITVIWDETGKQYSKGKGFMVINIQNTSPFILKFSRKSVFCEYLCYLRIGPYPTIIAIFQKCLFHFILLLFNIIQISILYQYAISSHILSFTLPLGNHFIPHLVPTSPDISSLPSPVPSPPFSLPLSPPLSMIVLFCSVLFCSVLLYDIVLHTILFYSILFYAILGVR
jgi:hypothetical protein